MIKTEHRGFGLQKIEVNTKTRTFLDTRGWYAMYYRRIDGVTMEAFGVSPEDAAQRASDAIDTYLATEQRRDDYERFLAPSRDAGETYGSYLYRVVQAFEEWVNRIAQEKLR